MRVSTSIVFVYCTTLGPAENEFGYNEYNAASNRILRNIIIDSSWFTTSSFLSSYLLVVNKTGVYTV